MASLSTVLVLLVVGGALFCHVARGNGNIDNYFTVKGGYIWINCTLDSSSYIRYESARDSTYYVLFFIDGGSSVPLPSGWAVFNTKRVRIQASKWESAGEYSCTSGRKTQRFYYSIISPAVIHGGETSVLTVKTTTSSMLTCSSAVRLGNLGQTLPTITWMLPSGEEAGAQGVETVANNLKNVSSRLDKRFSQEDDQKEITCRVMAGNKVVQETKATLNVLYPPHGVTVTTTTLKTIFSEGNRVQLTCKVAKAKPGVHRYVWFKQGAEVKETSNQLTIDAISKDDAGAYKCQAINDVGMGVAVENILVKYLTVNVMVSEPAISEGSSVTFTCEAMGLPGTVNFGMWKHTSVDGITRFVANSAGRSQLVIDNVQYHQAGKYCCSSSNGDFNKTSCTDLEVRFGPKVDVYKPQEFEVGTDIGQNRSLTLYVVANPPATKFEWFKGPPTDGVKMNKGKYHSNDTSSSLKFTKVAKDDYGNYSCRATNAVGSMDFHFELKPLGPASPPSGLSVTHRSAVSLTITWVSGFNGGRPQVFHLYYKPSNKVGYESHWNILDPGQRRLVTHKLRGLSPDTSYDIQVQSKSILSKEEDGLTGVIKASTKVRPAKPQNVTVVRHGNIAVVSWHRIRDNITRLAVEYCSSSMCHKKYVSVDQTSVDVEADENRHFTFKLLLYDGDDLVQTSETLNRQSVTDKAAGADIAGIIVGLIIVILIVIIVVIVFVQRRKKNKSIDEEMESDDSFESDHELEVMDKEREPESRTLLLDETPNNNHDLPKDSTVHVVVAQMSITPNKSAQDLRVDLPSQRTNHFRRSRSSGYISKGKDDSASLSSRSSTYKPPRPPPPSANSLKRRSLVYADLHFEPSESRESTPVKKSQPEIEYASIDFDNKGQRSQTPKSNDSLSML